MDTGPNFFLDLLYVAIYARDTDTKSLVKAAIETYNEEVNDDQELQDEMSRLYVGIAEEIIIGDMDLSMKAEISALIQKFKHNPTISKDKEIMKTIKALIQDRDTMSARSITNKMKKLRNWVMRVRSQKHLRRVFKKSMDAASTTDEMVHDLSINDALEAARNLVRTYESPLGKQQSTLEHIDMSCKSSVLRGVTAHRAKRKATGYKTGLQGLNRLLNGQIAPGEFVLFGALSYHYKSGMLMDITRAITTLNNTGPTHGKIPCVVFISLENEVCENLMMWYQAAYDNANGGGSEKLSDEELIDFVTDYFAKKGFKLLVFREMGEVFGYEEWVAMMTRLDSEGYDIKACIIDYMTLMHPGDGPDNEAKKIQKLFSSVKNYGNHHNITIVSGVQLDTEANRLASSGINNVVKRYTTAHLADCRGIMREADVFIFLHCEENLLGTKYLTMNITKHKYTKLPQETYSAYPFTPKGIMDDLHTENKEVLDIYAVSGLDSDSSAIGDSVF